MKVEWTDYMRYRAVLRGFDLVRIEHVLAHSTERYFDTTTQRHVVIGRHGNELVMVPYESDGEAITPVTIHVTTRQQVNFRVRTGRLINE